MPLSTGTTLQICVVLSVVLLVALPTLVVLYVYVPVKNRMRHFVEEWSMDQIVILRQPGLSDEESLIGSAVDDEAHKERDSASRAARERERDWHARGSIEEFIRVIRVVVPNQEADGKKEDEGESSKKSTGKTGTEKVKDDGEGKQEPEVEAVAK